jgi:hypothetical protein
VHYPDRLAEELVRKAMIVTVLVQNTRLEGRDDLRSGHGRLLEIRRWGPEILFDTGASRVSRETRRCWASTSELWMWL